MATLAHSAVNDRIRVGGFRSLLPLLGIASLAAAALWIGWVGFVFSDDVSYHQGALRWLTDPPFAGVDHWTTRFPLVLSLAAAIALLGDGLPALAATSLFWYAATVAAGTVLARRIGGERAGWIAAALLATMPLVATSGTVVNCDLPEAVFLIAGLQLLTGPDRPRHAVLAGLSFGAAILSRETALLALAGLAVPFVIGRPLPRRTLLLAAVAAAALLGAEMLFQYALTGDPLHRYQLAFHHDSTISRADNLEGNLLVHPLIDPLVVLFVNNEFGLLFPLAAAALLAGAARGLPPESRRALLPLAAMAASGFLLVALLGGKLVLNPRYFTLGALCAAILVAIWLGRLSLHPRAVLLAALIGSNLLLIAAQNRHPQWPADALVLAARAHPGRTIVADPETVRRAELPLRWSGLGNVRAVGPGLRLVREENGPMGGSVARYSAPPTPLGAALIALRLDPLVPAFARGRLLSPGPTMLLLPPEPRSR